MTAPGFCRCGEQHPWNATWCLTCDKPVLPKPAPAGEAEHLRELVLDQGEAIARLTLELGEVKTRLRTLEEALALPAAVQS